jgi:hypothetical protein
MIGMKGTEREKYHGTSKKLAMLVSKVGNYVSRSERESSPRGFRRILKNC